MKKSLFIMLAASLIAFNSLASNNCQKKGEDWKKKMMSEKIAFFTTEIGITPEEGQAFWPVYNQVNKEKKLTKKWQKEEDLEPAIVMF